MATGLPVAFCFLLVNLVGVFLFWNGEAGLRQLTLSIFDSVTFYGLLPVPLFLLMGEVMFHSGIAPNMLDVMDKWMGRLPGRLGLLAVAGGTLFATLSGSGLASVAMLGTVLTPEMEKRGYTKPMSLGPILGSAGLAIMIPPSALAVLLASLGLISIGKLLIAIIVPGLLMATLYAAYIIVRCQLQPAIAPAYEIVPTPLSEKIGAAARYVLPLGSVIFLVTGVIFLGIATPSEAAAFGAIGTLILAASYRKLNWGTLKKSTFGTLRVTVMMFMVITGAKAFSQILAFTGATEGLSELAVGLPLPPIVIIIAMQVILLVLGTFMDIVSIMMITLPIYMPVVQALGFDTVWFGALMLLNMEMAATTPPFGLTLFVMKGVAPPDTTMGDIYRAGLPFLGCDLIALSLMIAFPTVVLWLPSLMR
jgi:tripartite ATP-independent transporter DctM subunit